MTSPEMSEFLHCLHRTWLAFLALKIPVWWLLLCESIYGLCRGFFPGLFRGRGPRGTDGDPNRRINLR